MPKICYTERNFSDGSLRLINQANAIIRGYLAKGFRLTLRQLYYQFVSRDLLGNTVQNYKRLGSVVNDARLAGLIDWDAIEDRTRATEVPTVWDGPSEIVEAVARSYKIDLWADQPYRIEVWIEKEALAGVIEGVCRKLQVPYLSCRGYTSQSEMWSSAQRLRGHERHEASDRGQRTIILHLGDHDPSGIDMTRDIRDRLALFGSRVAIKRIALNYSQIEEYRPPPNPAKQTDARFAGYAQFYGNESWELDALNPEVMTALIEEQVHAYRDETLWANAVAVQEQQRAILQSVADRWSEVQHFLEEDQ